jgi:hypothetical protein
MLALLLPIHLALLLALLLAFLNILKLSRQVSLASPSNQTIHLEIPSEIQVISNFNSITENAYSVCSCGSIIIGLLSLHYIMDFYDGAQNVTDIFLPFN